MNDEESAQANYVEQHNAFEDVASHFQETAATATISASDPFETENLEAENTADPGRANEDSEEQDVASLPERPADPNTEHIGAVVYFSSISGNTARFITACNFPDEGINVYRIPLRAKEEPLQVREPYVLIVPTYGGGNVKKALLPQIRKFLNGRANRSFIRGVISSGNRNFASAFCAAGDIISQKCHVPFMYNFELIGTPDDHRKVREGVRNFFLEQRKQDAR